MRRSGHSRISSCSSSCTSRRTIPSLVVAVQARRHQAAGATAYQPDTTQVQFNQQFKMSTTNYNGKILKESHRKHNIALNLPPQMPPEGVDEPVYPESLTNALKEKPPQYAPTHDPPPLETTGSQQTSISRSNYAKVKPAAKDAPKAAPVAAAAAPAAPSKAASGPRVAAKRLTSADLKKTLDFEDITEGQLRDMIAIWDMWGPKVWHEYPEELRRGKNYVPTSSYRTTTPMAQEIKSVQKTLLTKEQLKKVPVYEDITETQVYEMIEFWDRYAPGAWNEYPEDQTKGKKFKSSKDFKATTTLSQVIANPLTAEGVAAAEAPTALEKQPVMAKVAQTGSEAGKLVKYPNPFEHDIPATAVPADHDIFISPFIKTAKMADAKKEPVKHFKADAVPETPWSCDHCGKSFRLQEALVRHYQQAHKRSIPQEKLAAMKLSIRTTVHGIKLTPSQAKAAAEARAYADGEGSPGSSASSASGGASQGGKMAAGKFQGELDVATHIRTIANTQLLGKIVKMDTGFLKAESAVQMILEVEETVKTIEPGTGEPKAVTSVEHIAVRCLGDEYTKSLRAGMRINDTVLVTGSLKLNRQVGRGSDKAYAHPYVQVVTPLGSVVKLEA